MTLLTLKKRLIALSQYRDQFTDHDKKSFNKLLNLCKPDAPIHVSLSRPIKDEVNGLIKKYMPFVRVTCPKCNRFLLEAWNLTGEVRIKCRTCSQKKGEPTLIKLDFPLETAQSMRLNSAGK